MKFIYRAVLLSWAWAWLAFNSQAQRPDSTFAVDVQQYSELQSADTSPQGKVAVIGQQAYTDGQLLGKLTVFDARGQVDAAFHQHAGVIDTNGASETLPALARFYPDGRLLLASPGAVASTLAPQLSATVIRLLANGAFDYSFQMPATFFVPTLRIMAIQPDGKILLAGSGNTASGVSLLIRLNANGTLDTGFSAVLGGRTSDYVTALAVQPDGKILVGGYFVSPAPALIRLLPNGQRDLTFQANVTSGGDVQEILLRPGGQILVAGRPTLTVQGRAGGLHQLLPTGSLDPAFQAPATYGFVKTGDGRRVHLLRNGNLLVLPTTPATATAVRLLASGQPDPAFTGFAQWPVQLRVATLDTAGALVLGGRFLHRTRTSPGSLYRMQPAGPLDPAFRPQLYEPGAVRRMAEHPGLGVVLAGRFDLVNGYPSPNLARLRPGLAEVDTAFSNRVPLTDALDRVLVQPPNNQLLVSGFSTVNGVSRGGVLRLNPAGQLDPLFRSYLPNYSVAGLAVQADGRFVMTGPFAYSFAYLDAARFLANGDFDPSFVVSQSLRLTNASQALVQPDGRVLLLDGPTAVRVQATGQFDPSFVPTAVRNYGSGLTTDVVLQPNGRITLCGQMPGAVAGQRASIIRLLANGRRDSTFTDPLDRSVFWAKNLAYQPDGRLLVGGFFLNYGASAAPTIGLYQLLLSGTPDPGFVPASGAGAVSAVLCTSSGRVMVGGSFFYFNAPLTQQLSFVSYKAAQPLAVVATRSAAVLAAYPNPAHAELMLQLDATASPRAVTLLDALGRPVLTQAVVNPEMRLTTSHLSPGTYLLRVDYAGGPVTRRVVIE
ncbi:T9SS type A sorting domain-containing protein [Hymenobacter convexus]|uniref:T9SS type A sorting domain-containing protein n=1 Tax=Hymenobacter sp. CA1UV-4 TaxID=3063782 RepID=UPI0027135859|nr:T9SS type A sorting domain-containing protein [Hymenobacter sp. CA1UV-4]MDO7850910.1 T9SS type A sorting domain-containing protein [Hymenobacter sp. CA1UV-4]